MAENVLVPAANVGAGVATVWDAREEEPRVVRGARLRQVGAGMCAVGEVVERKGGQVKARFADGQTLWVEPVESGQPRRKDR